MFTNIIKTPPTMDDNVGPLQDVRRATYKPTDMYFEILTKEDKRYEEPSTPSRSATERRTKDAGMEKALLTSAIARCTTCGSPMYLIKAEPWLARTHP